MAKKRPSKGSRKRKSPVGLMTHWLRAVLLWLLLLSLFFVAGYALLLDYRLRAHFEGKKWQLPAHVYAAAPEWFPGHAVTADELETQLQLLQFRRDVGLGATATYTRNGDQIRLRTRAFRFWDRVEPARQYRVTVQNGRIASIVDLETRHTVPLLRLTPLHIGNFYPRLQEDRVLVRLVDVPTPLIQGLLAMEDRHYFDHGGVSLRSILRALWANLIAGGIVQGGSTITQQFAKNFFLSSERTLIRKLNEAIFALLLEARYSKDEILEAYLNEIYLGQDGARAIHGVGLAAEYYFHRPLQELQNHELALLIALIRGPSYYDPWKQPQRALARRDLVLDKMAAAGALDAGQLAWARAQPLNVAEERRSLQGTYGAFLDLVRRQLRAEYDDEDLTTQGLQIHTTLDVMVQYRLQRTVAETVRRLEQRKGVERLQTAALFTRRGSAEVVGLVGGRDGVQRGFNRALDAVRPIGSLIKPVVYLTALEQGRYTVVSRLEDTALQLDTGAGKPWRPQNYDHKTHGTVALHTALAQSYNLATVRLGLDLGLPQVVRTLRRLGVEREIKAFPALLLGAVELSPLEVAQLYQTLADDGFVTPLRVIRAVATRDGRLLRRYPLQLRQGVSAPAVYLLNTILQEVVREGTARAALRNLPEGLQPAGKTGTTDNLRDSWFAGFAGDYVGVVWIGRDDNQPVRLSGASGALQVWTEVMRRISRAPLELTRPAEVEWVAVESDTGLRAAEGCATARRYPFLRGTAPEGYGWCGQPPAASSPAPVGWW